MATTTVDINSGSGTNGWTQVATDAENFIVENLSVNQPAYARFAAAAPAAEAAGHAITQSQPLVRAGCDGALWVRTPSEQGITLVVSTGAI